MFSEFYAAMKVALAVGALMLLVVIARLMIDAPNVEESAVNTYGGVVYGVLIGTFVGYLVRAGRERNDPYTDPAVPPPPPPPDPDKRPPRPPVHRPVRERPQRSR